MKVRHIGISIVGALLIFSGTSMGASAGAANIEQITAYSDGEKPNNLIMQALISAFSKANPSIKVDLEIGPTGVESVELVKARVSKGTMSDVFLYYPGSLFQSLNPTRNLVELTKEPWHSSIIKSFFPSVSVGAVSYGAPLGSAMGGGILYNKAIYKKYKLKVPLTWQQFMANNALLKRVGITPVIQTYKDSWTAQMLILADGFNLLANSPTFPQMFTSNRVQISTSSAARAGFNHLAEIYKKGYTNSDFKTIGLSKGLEYLATGKGAHYPMLTFVDNEISTKFPAQADDIGIFALPGNSAKSNGLTIWMPNALLIPKLSQHVGAAKKFIAFATSPEGLAIIGAAVKPSGPYMVAGAKLTGDSSMITKDMLTYFNVNGRTAPALEFLSPIKGPNLSNIAVQVGTGVLTGKLGAVAYDNDVRAESRRLGLPGWGKLN